MTLPGLMQQGPLLIRDILRYAAAAHGDREIASRLVGEPDWRYDYAGLAERSERLAAALTALGMRSGDRVTSLAWNTHRHLELFYAVPGMGAVLHTANPRFSEQQLIFTINHAGSRMLLFDSNFAGLIEKIRPSLTSVERFVVMAETAIDQADSYEQLLDAARPGFEWPTFDENSAAFLCYTSGTTGDPKGVVYSNRSVVIHALAGGLTGALDLTAFDCILPCQSLYHATGWGVPFIAPINGCKLVLPCDKFDGASMQQLIREEGVTFSGGVPTIWTMYLDHLQRSGEDSGTLQRVIIGGSAVPRAMAETFQTRYGVKVRQLWGMTETSPLGVVASPTPKVAARGQQALDDTILTRQGRRVFGLELKIVDDDGQTLAHDGEHSGRVLVRGPWTIERYFRSETSATDADGWFDTGDIATMDGDGFMRITDRGKDVIKSGGEWISSIDIENAAAAFPGVKVAAVIGVAHPKWEERPLLIIEPLDGETIEASAVRKFLETRIVKWWMPDAVLFGEVPLTATGKIDKKALRDRYRDFSFEQAPTAAE